VLDGILQDKANPNATAGRVVRKVLFGSPHPYGWSVGGEEKSVKSLERSELEHFYRTHYSPSNACLVMVGDIDVDQAHEVAEKVLAKWKAAPYPEMTVEPVACAERRIYLVDRPGAAQSELRLAMLAPERSTADYHALQVLNNVLGGGFSSRLNLNLREQKGYSYGAFSAIRFGRFQSLLLGIAPVETRVTKEAIQEMLAEFEAMASWARPVTDEELATSKNTLMRGYAQRFETLGQVAGEIAELEGFGLPLEEIERYPKRIQDVNLDQIGAAARKYLTTDRLVLVVVGDASKVEGGLRSLGLGDPIRIDADGKPV
jgi:zinc protease